MNWLEPGMDLNPHSHPFEQVVYIVQGKVRFHIGDETFDAGPGNTVTAGHGGIKYWLREVTETWQVVNDILAYDPTAVGFQSGASSGSIHVPVDTTLTADLPPGNFYFLFVTFEASDDSAHNVGVNPIIIVP